MGYAVGVAIFLDLCTPVKAVTFAASPVIGGATYAVSGTVWSGIGRPLRMDFTYSWLELIGILDNTLIWL